MSEPAIVIAGFRYDIVALVAMWTNLCSAIRPDYARSHVQNPIEATEEKALV